MSGMREEVVAFVADHMRKNPEISMSELQKLAGPKKLNVYPLILGLARKKLGIKKAGPSRRGPGRPPAAGKRGPGRPPGSGKRGPGRPRRASDPAAALSQIIGHVRDLEREVNSLRTALAKISDIARG